MTSITDIDALIGTLSDMFMIAYGMQTGDYDYDYWIYVSVVLYLYKSSRPEQVINIHHQ